MVVNNLRIKLKENINLIDEEMNSAGMGKGEGTAGLMIKPKNNLCLRFANSFFQFFERKLFNIFN
jgi:hypothetical protein